MTIETRAPVADAPATTTPAASPSAFAVRLFVVEGIRLHPDPEAKTLTLVKLAGHPDELVANMREDGSWRYKEGDLVVLFPVNAILPEAVLKRMGYWKEKEGGKGKGLLGGNKGNRVAARTFVGIESRGALMPVELRPSRVNVGVLTSLDGSETREVEPGDDLTAFFGVTEYVNAKQALE